MSRKFVAISVFGLVVTSLTPSAAFATGFPKPGEELTCSEQMVFEDSCEIMRRTHRLVLTAEAALGETNLGADLGEIQTKLIEAKVSVKEGMAKRACPEYKNIDTAAEKIMVPINEPRVYRMIRNCPEAFVAFQSLRDALTVSSRAEGIFFGLRVDARKEIREAKDSLRSFMEEAHCFAAKPLQ